MYSAIVFILFTFLFSLSSSAVITGTDYGGNDLIPSDGDQLSGSFTNVGLFHISPDTTIFITEGQQLKIEAEEISVEGRLDGDGRGYVGGLGPEEFDDPGNAGSGPGGGAGGLFLAGTAGTGGGGAGHASQGGHSSTWQNDTIAVGAGGVAYGVEDSRNADMGSGGGSGAGTGGAGGSGGGAIELYALHWLNVTEDGVISANGEDGYQSPVPPGNVFGTHGGGGGSGGTILLSGVLNLRDATLSVEGGDGADANISQEAEFMSGGGGGAGGRIKLFGNIFSDQDSLIESEGGINGVGYESPGAPDDYLDSKPGGSGSFSFTQYGINAHDDFDYSVGVTETITIDVLANDVSTPSLLADIEPQSLSLLNQPAKGTASILGQGTVLYEPETGFQPTSVSFEYTVCIQQSYLICDTAIVEIDVVNQPPLFVSTPPVSQLNVGALYLYNVIVTDPEGQTPLTISTVAIPSWITFSANPETGTALLNGNPSLDDVGAHTVSLLATDAFGNTATQTFSVQVDPVHDGADPTPTPIPTPAPTPLPVILPPVPAGQPTPMPVPTPTPVPMPTPTPEPYIAPVDRDTAVRTQIVEIDDFVDSSTSSTVLQLTTNDNQLVGSVEIPAGTSTREGALKVTIQPAPRRLAESEGVLSAAIAISFQDSRGRTISKLHEPVDICLQLGERQADIIEHISSTVEDDSDPCDDDDETAQVPCLSTVHGDSSDDEWECVDQQLRRSEQQKGFVCGQTTEFSSFAVLLTGVQRGGECSSDGGNYFTGSLLWDCLTTVFVLVLVFTVFCVFVVLATYVKPVRRFVYGEEAERMRATRKMVKTRKQIFGISIPGTRCKSSANSSVFQSSEEDEYDGWEMT